MPTENFYSTVTTVSFTLLGLWWVVIENRPDWRRDRRQRAVAFTGTLHFALPGAMSLLSIAAPDAALLWRASFAVAALTGLVGTVALAEASGRPTPARSPEIEWVGIPIHVAILAFAAIPGLAKTLGLGVTDLVVEAVIVAVLLLFGVVAALLAFLGGPADGA